MPVGPLTPPPAPLPPPPPMYAGPAPAVTPPPTGYVPDQWAPAAPAPVAPAPAPAGPLVEKGRALMAALAEKLYPLAPKPQVLSTTGDRPLGDKIAQIGRSALFFALPVGGAALVACGLGWLVGPWVPFVGGHVFGAVAATLAVGHTAGFLLHGAMRLPLVTKPEDRELNSAGVAVAGAGLGAAFAWGIAAAAGATVTPWILLGGAALGALPRVLEWMGGRAI